ncbi:hypothetical protein AR687_07835 [Flavobacteriaceae bacterium CRH]|nr:hypothetical protein AR687_07835 [Flavobacteriaceae bacterium CRH]
MNLAPDRGGILAVKRRDIAESGKPCQIKCLFFGFKKNLASQNLSILGTFFLNSYFCIKGEKFHAKIY